MDRETARQTIRSRISCAEYLQKSKSGLYCCPKCGSGSGTNATGAVKYYPDSNTWHCFSCDCTGDVIDLYQQATGADYNAALSSLAAEIGVTIDPYRPAAATEFAPIKENDRVERATSGFSGRGNTDTPPATKSPQSAAERATADYTAYYKECAPRIIDPAAAAYLERRGFSIYTAGAYMIGFDPAADPASAPGGTGTKRHPCPRIIVPCSAAHYVARSIDPNTQKEYKALNPAGSTPAIFNVQALYAQDAQAVFVAEGWADALSVIEAGAAAIALNSAANADALIDQLERRGTEAILILCLDNDERGKKATETIRCGLQRLKIAHITANICGGHKDPNEYLQADRGAFIEAVQTTARQAGKLIAQQREAAQQAEQERQQRTGASMIDAFLEAVRTRKYEPVPTGITDIDNAIGGGFFRQQLILLGAAPGAGKTSLAQWVFEGMAKRGQTCLYLNLEMSRDQMLARSISRIAAQNGDRIKATDILQGYKWDWTQEAVVLPAAEKYKTEIAPRMIYNPDGVTADLDSILEYINAEAERAEAAELPAPCVVLDYLQIVRGREREDDTAIIKRAMGSLKKFAIEHNTFVFVIMANNRASNRTGDVTMESGRDSSALEYGADVQLGLAYTMCLKKNGGKAKEDLTPDEMKLLTLKITKGRWGGPGKDVNLHFDGETMTYTQTTTDFIEPPKARGRV